MFINLTNHPSEKWGEKQLSEAIALGGKIVDMPFPQIDPKATTLDIEKLASSYIAKCLDVDTNFKVLIQGEFTFVYNFVTFARNLSKGCYTATTERKAFEYINDKGEVIKTSIFEFVQFREY